MKKRRNWNKSSGKHSAELKGLYAAEWRRLAAQPAPDELAPEELQRRALEPGRQRLAEIRREHLAKAREALKLKRDAEQERRRREAIRRFEAERKARIIAKKTDT